MVSKGRVCGVLNVPSGVRSGVVVLAVLSAVAVSWGPGAEVARACSCQVPESEAEAVERSDVAFTGRLVERIDPDPLLTSSDAVRYVFEVELVHKGSVGPRVEVESAVQSTSCGAVVSEEFPMFVVASKEGGRLTTSLCAGNRPITDLEGPPRIAGQAPAPPAGQRQQPTSTDEVAAPAARASCEDGSVDCDDTGGRTDYTLIASLAAGAALAVAAAAGAVWMSRRRARAQ
jgi:hypothetical protein